MRPAAPMPEPPPLRVGTSALRAGTANLWDRAAIAGLATAGFVLSYDALRQMAAASHVRPLLTWLFPLIVDGFIAYGVRALLLMRGERRAARVYVWLLLAVATGASIWANVLHAVVLNQRALAFTSGPSPHSDSAGLRLDNTVVGILSALAPLALAGAVHLHTLIHQPHSDTATSTETAATIPTDARLPEAGRSVECNSGQATIAPHAHPAHPTAEGLSGPLTPGPADAARDEQVSAPDASGRAADADPDAGVTAPVDPSPGPEFARRGRRPVADDKILLDIARTAVADTGCVSRATVRDAIRAEGLAVGNDRLTQLMAQVRSP